MARANRYYMPGLIWDITHRCHRREFLLKFARDRRRWMHWLFEAKKRYGLRVLNFAATSKHIHLLAEECGEGVVGKSLQLVSGVLTNKVYADNNGTDYGYDALNQLTNVNYSATNTPDIAYSYDRQGRQTQVVQSSTGVSPVIHQFAYDASTLALTNETVIANGATNSIARSYDSYGRSDGFAFDSYDVDYGFDSTGRFGTLAATNGSVAVANVDYNYMAGSDLLAGTTNSVPGLGTTRSFETNRDLLTEIHNQSGGTTVS